MSRVAKPPSIIEIKNELLTSLRRTAVNPSIAGYRPQAHQIPFHKSEKQGRLFLGGNRAGKTVAGGAEVVMWLTGQHLYYQKFRPPIRARAIGVDFDNGVNRIIKPEIARWIPPSMLQNGSWEDSYEKSSKTLTLANGSTLEFMSYDQDVQKFAGTSRHLIWFDEEPPEEIFNENLMRLLDVDGSWIMTMTPLIDMSWTFDRLFTKGTSGTVDNIDVFEAATSQNSYINEAAISVITEGLSDDEALARTQGKYYSYTGTIYSGALSPEVFCDPIHNSDQWPIFQNPGNWTHFGMLDHGYNNPTAFLLGCADRDGRVIIYYEYYHNKRLVKENAEAIREIFRELQIVPEYIVADPSIRNKDPIGGGSIHAEYAEHGLHMGLANNDVISGINRVSSRLKNKQLFITRNCEKLIWELERYRWEKYSTAKIANKNNIRETPMKKDDHACDALRYGIVSRPELPGEIQLKSGNILHTSEAIGKELFDYELLRENNSEAVFDEILGDDW
jgi:phage terminase large subunit-like protein